MDKRIKGRAAQTRKRVNEEPESQPAKRYLVWRFGRLSYESVFGCHTLQVADVPQLEKELVTFQATPIWELRQKEWLKFVEVEDMTPDGQKCLAAVSKQENGLWQLHLHHDKWRIWGYFEDPEFFFLWWDDDHGVATGKSRHRKRSSGR